MRPKSGVRIAVIGAGGGGIATAFKLTMAGYTNFTVYERSDGIGGTWHLNDYPGCEVDIHSYFYSFSFMPWVWSRTHATQPEIKRYMEATVDRFALRPHFRLNTGVESVTWDEGRSAYELELSDGTADLVDVVVSAVGMLNDPRYPTWPGLEDFKGVVFHTARWEHEHDLRGKKVAFVGTGSTASQAVPALAPMVGELLLFQREPGWVIPKGDYDYSEEELERFRRSRARMRFERFKQFFQVSRYVRGAWTEGTRVNTDLRDMSLAHIEESIDSPEKRRAVTPTFAFGCKRTIQAGTYYPAIDRENVTLVPHAVERVTPRGLVAHGREFDVDAIIIGTGFKAQEYLSTVNVHGIGGRELKEEWNGTARAFLGMSVPGFPNFFMLYGPNTNGGGSILFNLERQAEVVTRLLRRVRRGHVVDTRDRAYWKYSDWIDKRTEKRLTAQLQCHNYYFSESGRNVTQWPGSHALYWAVTKLLPPFGFTSRRPARPHAPRSPAKTATTRTTPVVERVP